MYFLPVRNPPLTCQLVCSNLFICESSLSVPALAQRYDYKNANGNPRVIARFDFAAEEEGELSFNRGDVIDVIRQDSENWWYGHLPNGQKGLFPSNYVDLLPSVS